MNFRWNLRWCQIFQLATFDDTGVRRVCCQPTCKTPPQSAQSLLSCPGPRRWLPGEYATEMRRAAARIHQGGARPATGHPHLKWTILCWLVVWNMNFIFPYIGNNKPNWPNWLSYFSEGWLNHQPVMPYALNLENPPENGRNFPHGFWMFLGHWLGQVFGSLDSNLGNETSRWIANWTYGEPNTYSRTVLSWCYRWPKLL